MIYKNCTLPNGDSVDMEVKYGSIKRVGRLAGKPQEIKDLQGSLIVPKLVDLNVRLKDGLLSAASIKECADEARCGGVGYVLLRPDTTPRIDNEISLEFAHNSIKDITHPTIEVAASAFKEDLTLSEIAILLKKGASTLWMSTKAKNNTAIRVAEYLKMYKKTLLCKAEDNSLISQGVMHEGDVSSRLGLAGILELSEILHVSRMIEIARYYDISILFESIANPRSLEMIQKAREEGIEVYAEVSLHHLLFSDQACEGFNTIAKLDPPLVDTHSRAKLLEALKSGAIDTLTLLHAPSSPLHKEVAFYDAAYGSSALSDAWPLYYSKLVQSKILSLQELIKLCVETPLKILGKKPTRLEVDASIGDFVALDLNAKHKINNSNSLYNGELLDLAITEL